MMRAAATRRPGARRGAAALEFALGARFARVCLCDPPNTTDPSGCGRVNYVPLISTGLVPGGTFQFPRFDTITPAGTFGYRAGTAGTCT